MANKQDLVNKVQEISGFTVSNSEKAVKAVVEAITGFINENEDVVIAKFGKFTVADRAARKGRNPKTGEEIKIEAKRVPVFKPANALKDSVK